MPILECNKLTKTYGGVTALDHIDLAIDPRPTRSFPIFPSASR